MMMKIKHNIFTRTIYCVFLFIFLITNMGFVQAQSVLSLPSSGEMIFPTSHMSPIALKGMKVYPDQPFQFDFLLDTGSIEKDAEDLEIEASKLIRYFLSALTVPEDNLWVNLSPYEGDRIIPEQFSLTEMGRDLLAQDYILKQLTSSLLYPEGDIGKVFWEQVYQKAYDLYGTTDIPIDTFNKVWITPQKATIYVHNQHVLIKDSQLQVLLESDYVAQKEQGLISHSEDRSFFDGQSSSIAETEIAKDMMRELIIPVLEKEVNEGALFAPLRQIYHAMVLSTWFKRHWKQSFVGQAYVDQNKVMGIDFVESKVKQEIWQQYVQAFQKGVFNYIKEEVEEMSGELIPRKYFSGGFVVDSTAVTEIPVDSLELMRATDNSMSIVSTQLLPQDFSQVTSQAQGTLQMGDIIISPSGTRRIVLDYPSQNQVRFQVWKKETVSYEIVDISRALDFINNNSSVEKQRLSVGDVLVSKSGTMRKIIFVQNGNVQLQVFKAGKQNPETRPVISVAGYIGSGIVTRYSSSELVTFEDFKKKLDLLKSEPNRLYHRMLKLIAETLNMKTEAEGKSYLTVRGNLEDVDSQNIFRELSQELLMAKLQLTIKALFLFDQLKEYDINQFDYVPAMLKLFELLKRDFGAEESPAVESPFAENPLVEHPVENPVENPVAEVANISPTHPNVVGKDVLPNVEERISIATKFSLSHGDSIQLNLAALNEGGVTLNVEGVDLFFESIAGQVSFRRRRSREPTYSIPKGEVISYPLDTQNKPKIIDITFQIKGDQIILSNQSTELLQGGNYFPQVRHLKQKVKEIQVEQQDVMRVYAEGKTYVGLYEGVGSKGDITLIIDGQGQIRIPVTENIRLEKVMDEELNRLDHFNHRNLVVHGTSGGVLVPEVALREEGEKIQLKPGGALQYSLGMGENLGTSLLNQKVVSTVVASYRNLSDVWEYAIKSTIGSLTLSRKTRKLNLQDVPMELREDIMKFDARNIDDVLSSFRREIVRSLRDYTKNFFSSKKRSEAKEIFFLYLEVYQKLKRGKAVLKDFQKTGEDEIYRKISAIPMVILGDGMFLGMEILSSISGEVGYKRVNIRAIGVEHQEDANMIRDWLESKGIFHILVVTKSDLEYILDEYANHMNSFSGQPIGDVIDFKGLLDVIVKRKSIKAIIERQLGKASQNQDESQPQDSAEKSSPVGGIDLNDQYLDLWEEGDNIDLRQFIPSQKIEDIHGFSPVILNITPLGDASLFVSQ